MIYIATSLSFSEFNKLNWFAINSSSTILYINANFFATGRYLTQDDSLIAFVVVTLTLWPVLYVT